MKSSFYFRLAWNNIKKNYRFFIPRVLAETGLLGCFYIALTLAMDKRLAEMKGGAYIPVFMWIGVAVLAILSVVLLFYTNSFLMKQRKREFGLYNVLGMEKKHVGKVLFHESFICGAVSVLAGLGLGVLFYKVCSLLICKLLKSSVIIGFYFITPKTLIPAGAFFVLVDFVTYLFNRISISRMKPVELLESRSAGEKEPKVKWLMLILGVLTLGGGYYLAITTKNPLQALGIFFLAVILVIVGTYFLFVTGSTFVLKALRKNKKYYYNPKHMPAVSGLLYRMKQNAVGLASIAILATGVLVMISSTVSLYAGMQGTLDRNYPQHLYVTAAFIPAESDSDHEQNEEFPPEKLEETVRKAAEDCNVSIKDLEYNSFLNVSYYLKDNALLAESEVTGDVSFEGISSFIFITEETYTDLTGEKLGLKGREIATCRISSSISSAHSLEGTLTIHGNKYGIVKDLVLFPINTVLLSGFSTYGIVVSGDDVFDEIYENQKTAYGEYASDVTKRVAVTFEDINAACDAGNDIEQGIFKYISESVPSDPEGRSSYMCRIDSYWNAREALTGMYGTLFFLGILLGAVCLFATVLIIYYKQIAEGYEDRDRFQIMEKIGMSKQEVRKTINSQVLLVFFLPLIVAGVHMAFAFPLVKGILCILALYKTSLFLISTLITFAFFAIIYILIYKATSRTYYKIVQ